METIILFVLFQEKDEDPQELKVKVEPEVDRLDLEGLLLSPRNNGQHNIGGRNGLTLCLKRSLAVEDIAPIRRQRSKSESEPSSGVILRRSSRTRPSSPEKNPQESDGEPPRSRLMSWSVTNAYR